MSKLHRLMSDFIKIDEEVSLVGRGPDHPVRPKNELRKYIDEFLKRNSFLRQDPDYVSFLYCYAGASIDKLDRSLTAFILGFEEEVSYDFINDAYAPEINKDGFFIFCTSVVDTPADDAAGGVGLDYAFDATGKRRWGVYINVLENEESESPLIETSYHWYCETFLEWLEQFIQKLGRLF